jgi:hypothetical protein
LRKSKTLSGFVKLRHRHRVGINDINNHNLSTSLTIGRSEAIHATLHKEAASLLTNNTSCANLSWTNIPVGATLVAARVGSWTNTPARVGKANAQ